MVMLAPVLDYNPFITVAEACRLMGSITCSIPEFTCISAAKVASLYSWSEYALLSHQLSYKLFAYTAIWFFFEQKCNLILEKWIWYFMNFDLGASWPSYKLNIKIIWPALWSAPSLYLYDQRAQSIGQPYIKCPLIEIYIL